ncbi:MAG: hypothetical protein JXM72_12305 [Deltaproteobacteria bacterium]|nr:hypothetical protein [Deltaproteobacteria bacterium]
MQKVPIDLAAPGMILAKPVTNEKGMPLCAEGTELNANLIERLKKMNVSALVLKGHPVDLGIEEKSTDEKLQEMDAKFARLEGDPIMNRLRDAIASAIASEGIDEKEDAGENKESTHE